jgi:uncharacterized protein YciI
MHLLNAGPHVARQGEKGSYRALKSESIEHSSQIMKASKCKRPRQFSLAGPFLLHQAFALLGLPLEPSHRETNRDADQLTFWV